MKMGGIRAHPRQAMAALDGGAVVLVYPGGGDEVYRSDERRNEVDLPGRMGFVKLALRYGAPIVPLVAAGGHRTLIVLDEGERLARWLGLDRRGIPRLPISLSLPWGLAVGFPYNIPFPARIDIRVGEPIRFDEVGPDAARDRGLVREPRARAGADADARRDGRLPRMSGTTTGAACGLHAGEGAPGSEPGGPRRIPRHPRRLPRGGAGPSSRR
jgi:1-acyl-sn-glycerol-3-phosphate acyltransferase